MNSADNYLYKMLDMLTSAYNRSDVQSAKLGEVPKTNIGKVFALFAYGFRFVSDNSDKMTLWQNLDNVSGKVLDRFGANLGVSRNGVNDAFYRIMIRVKLMSQLSGGDTETVIRAASVMLDINPNLITYSDVYPAKVWLYVDRSLLDSDTMEVIELIAKMLKRIVAAGVGFKFYLRYYGVPIGGRTYLNSGIFSQVTEAVEKGRPPNLQGSALFNSGVITYVTETVGRMF